MFLAPTTYLPSAMTAPTKDVGRLTRLLQSRHAQWLTHGPLILITAAYFAALVALPFWLAFLPCVVLAHRIGTLLHEYIHGIPFRRYAANHAVVTLYDGIMLMFGTFEMFRVSHLEHHRWLNTNDDEASGTAGKVGRSRLRDVIAGFSLVQYLMQFRLALLGRKQGVRRNRIVAAALISTACIAAWAFSGHGDVVWKMLAVTAFTMAVPVSLRSAIEHHSHPGDPSFANEYRVWIPLFNLNRHIHHHEDPSVPWYRLRWRTARPLPRWHYVGHWFRVYVKRQFVLMRPMRSSDVRREARPRALVAFLFAISQGAPPDSVVRKQLDAPQVVSGVTCDRTGSAYAEFFENGALRSCPIAADTTIATHAFARGTWITLRRAGTLQSAWLSRDTRLAGHLCHGKGYKGFHVTFHDDESLRSCYFARDTIIDGIPCIHGSFWTEIRGGTRTAALFQRDGSLAACQLFRRLTVSGRDFPKWSRVRRAADGSISEVP